MKKKDFNIKVDKWLEEVVRIKVKQSTYYTYKYRINKYIKPYFKEISIVDVTIDTMRDFVGNLKVEKSGRTLSPQSVRGIVVIVNEFYKYQIVIKSLSYNPCIGLSLPTIKTKQINTLNEDEQIRLLKYLINDGSCRSCMVITALFTGMRIGELCSLTWDDVDLELKMIKVSTTKQRVINPSANKKTKVIIDTAKTNKSIRRIPISEFLVEKLLIMKNNHNNSKNIVFSNKNNTGYDVRSIQKYYTKTCEKLFIRNTNFHCLRHTFATRAMQTEIDIKTLSLLLGHSNITTTLNLYVHPDEKHIRNRIEIISKNLSRNL